MENDNEPLGHDAWVAKKRLDMWEAKKSAYDPTQDIYTNDLEEAEGLGEAILLCVVFVLLMGGVLFFPQILKKVVELLV